MHSVSITEWRRRIGAHAPRVPLQRPKSTRYYRQSPKNGGSVLFIVCTVLFSLLLGTLLDTVEEIGCTPLKLSAGTYGRAKRRNRAVSFPSRAYIRWLWLAHQHNCGVVWTGFLYLMVAYCSYVIEMLLMVAGDVERNPGPTLGPSNLLTVLEELCGVRFKWYNIGLQLGLSMGILETIRHDYRDQSMDCLREVLRTWLKSGCDTTWNRVIQGLMSPAVAEGRLSCALKTKYYPQLPTGESASGFPLEPSPTPETAMSRYATHLKNYYNRIPMPRMEWSTVGGSNYIEPAIADQLVTSRQEAKGDRIQAQLEGDLKLQNKSLVRKEDMIKPSAGKLPKCVLLQGAPGVGKTTFVWKFCREWAEGVLYQVYRLVVLHRLQDRRAQAAETLYDVFYHDSKVLRQELIEEIAECGGENVLIILDGLDEFPDQLHKPLISNLIDGVSLPAATLLITTRPSGTLTIFDCISPQGKISRHFEILGFTNESIEQYYTSAFETVEEVHDFMDYLSINPCIREMMYIPLNSAIVIEVYKSRKYTLGTSNPHTLTELYTSLCCTLLHRYMSKKKLRRRGLSNFDDLPQAVHCDFMNICQKAFEMLDKQQPDTHYTPDPDKVFNDLGFMNSSTVVRPDGFSVSYFFQHSTVQKYLAAVYISTLPAARQADLLRIHHLHCHFEYVWRFFAGLTQFQSIGWQMMKEICFKVGEDRRDLEDIQFNSSTGMHQQSLVLDLTTSGLHWLYELHPKVETFEILDGVVSKFRSTSSLSPFDCLALGTCISYSQCKWDLTLSGDISPEAIKILSRTLKEPQSDKVGVVKLDLCIGQNSILFLTSLPTGCYQNVCELRLRRSSLDPTLFPDSIVRFMEVIAELPELTVLDLSYNRFHNGGAKAVIRQLLKASRLQELCLRDTEIGPVDIKAVCALLNSPFSNLEKLDLSENDLSPESLTLLSCALGDDCAVTEIDLSFSNFDRSSMNSFASMLQRDNTLKVLSIKNCGIDDVSASYLVSALSDNLVIDKVYLGGNPCVESGRQFSTCRAINVDISQRKVFDFS